MKYLTFVLILISSLAAQTATKKAPAKAPVCKESKEQSELKQVLTDDLARERARSADLEKQLAEANKKYSDAIAILDTLAAQSKGNQLTESQKAKLASVQPGDALNLGVEVEQQEQNMVNFAMKLKEHDEMATDKYNSLLSDYKDYVNRVGIQLAQINRQQRISNALALYNVMKPAPIQLPLPTTPASINCTSNTMGATTFTNCH